MNDEMEIIWKSSNESSITWKVKVINHTVIIGSDYPKEYGLVPRHNENLKSVNMVHAEE